MGKDDAPRAGCGSRGQSRRHHRWIGHIGSGRDVSVGDGRFVERLHLADVDICAAQFPGVKFLPGVGADEVLVGAVIVDFEGFDAGRRVPAAVVVVDSVVAVVDARVEVVGGGWVAVGEEVVGEDVSGRRGP